MLRSFILDSHKQEADERQCYEDDKTIIHPGKAMKDSGTFKAEHSKEYCRQDSTNLEKKKMMPTIRA